MPVDGARWISLTKGLFVLVDEDVFDDLNKTLWHLKSGYASVEVDGQAIFMHHKVLGIDSSIEVDHQDRNRLDCRRSNLRIATHAQNMANKPKKVGDFTSKYKGVSFDARRGRWRTNLTVEGHLFSKRYDTEVEAAVAYDALATHHVGKFAVTNFPWETVAP
jgi:HNH endonuclease/AP2 domain